MAERYPVETLPEDDDNGTMPENVAELSDAVIGRRIISAGKETTEGPYGWTGFARAAFLANAPAEAGS